MDDADLQTPAITHGGVRNVGEAPKGEEFWDRTMDDSVEMEAISIPSWLKGLVAVTSCRFLPGSVAYSPLSGAPRPSSRA